MVTLQKKTMNDKYIIFFIDVQAFITGYGMLADDGYGDNPYACWTDGTGPVRYTA